MRWVRDVNQCRSCQQSTGLAMLLSGFPGYHTLKSLEKSLEDKFGRKFSYYKTTVLGPFGWYQARCLRVPMGCIPAGMAEVPAHWDSGKLGGHDRGWGTGSFSTLEEKVFQVKTSAIATYLPNISKYGLRRSQICKVTCISIYQYHLSHIILTYFDSLKF